MFIDFVNLNLFFKKIIWEGHFTRFFRFLCDVFFGVRIPLSFS